jgi:hypothetical protein
MPGPLKFNRRQTSVSNTPKVVNQRTFRPVTRGNVQYFASPGDTEYEDVQGTTKRQRSIFKLQRTAAMPRLTAAQKNRRREYITAFAGQDTPEGALNFIELNPGARLSPQGFNYDEAVALGLIDTRQYNNWGNYGGGGTIAPTFATQEFNQPTVLGSLGSRELRSLNMQLVDPSQFTTMNTYGGNGFTTAVNFAGGRGSVAPVAATQGFWSKTVSGAKRFGETTRSRVRSIASNVASTMGNFFGGRSRRVEAPLTTYGSSNATTTFIPSVGGRSTLVTPAASNVPLSPSATPGIWKKFLKEAQKTWNATVSGAQKTLNVIGAQGKSAFVTVGRGLKKGATNIGSFAGDYYRNKTKSDEDRILRQARNYPTQISYPASYFAPTLYTNNNIVLDEIRRNALTRNGAFPKQTFMPTDEWNEAIQQFKTDHPVEPFQMVNSVNVRQIKIVPSFFTGKGKKGDFTMMIEDPSEATSLFIFNDNLQDQGSNRKGGGNAAIRGHKNAFGIPTGSAPGANKGFTSLNEKFGGADVEYWIMDRLRELRTKLLNGNYTKVYYSASREKTNNDHYSLGTSIFVVNKTVKDFIVDSLYDFVDGTNEDLREGKGNNLPSDTIASNESQKKLLKVFEKEVMSRIIKGEEYIESQKNKYSNIILKDTPNKKDKEKKLLNLKRVLVKFIRIHTILNELFGKSALIDKESNSGIEEAINLLSNGIKKFDERKQEIAEELKNLLTS